MLVHWACAKVSAAPDMPDDKLASVLDAKLKGRQGMQYAAIAAHARALGRTSLAATLLDREPRASEQVSSSSYLQRLPGHAWVCHLIWQQSCLTYT